MAIDKQNAKAKEVGHLFVSENGDAAKYAPRLLDTISLNGEIAAALTELKEKFEEVLPKYAVERLETIIEASSCVHAVGLKQTTKVSTVNVRADSRAEEGQRQEYEEAAERGRDRHRAPIPLSGGHARRAPNANHDDDSQDQGQRAECRGGVVGRSEYVPLVAPKAGDRAAELVRSAPVVLRNFLS
eukprot:CAMPEP_0172531074 /NCGR_PEP_ID=MMETSP1067-20121228/4614_1 /TAXON_ID=265564 ORGANISM="Thalassiosira punctigera, Strain Tpunct2005C2" /NCGR_SAMPLE_ID=MMETSP1067 /ASSEMBLY_ACC=CAM_ASM_000444 /LENGTH=185 /DNA_ID=CAMNT_0013315401 /DNA_START=213 /DNA_END=766 /DNA_ORIENTATION=+